MTVYGHYCDTKCDTTNDGKLKYVFVKNLGVLFKLNEKNFNNFSDFLERKADLYVNVFLFF